MSIPVVPPFLAPGDVIGLVCPAGFMETERTDACQAKLESWGYKVRRGKTIGGSSSNYFSGTDAQRLADLQQMMDDPSVQAILCGRGGYGLSRIIDQLHFKKFIRNPKWILGYSDITLLHSHIYRKFGIVTAHSPMAGAFNDPMSPNEYTGSVADLLAGKKMSYAIPGHVYNRPGTAVGPLTGGNLTLLAHAIGTGSGLKTKGSIVFLEDIGEYLYNIDRMLRQLKRAGKLDKASGMVIGHFTDCKDTERPFGQDAYSIVREVLKDFDFPVCYGFPVGHQVENYALKHGMLSRLQVSPGTVKLTEEKIK